MSAHEPKSNKENLRDYHGRRFVITGAFGILKSQVRVDYKLIKKILALEQEVNSSLKANYYHVKRNLQRK